MKKTLFLIVWLHMNYTSIYSYVHAFPHLGCYIVIFNINFVANYINYLNIIETILKSKG